MRLHRYTGVVPKPDLASFSPVYRPKDSPKSGSRAFAINKSQDPPAEVRVQTYLGTI